MDLPFGSQEAAFDPFSLRKLKRLKIKTKTKPNLQIPASKIETFQTLRTKALDARAAGSLTTGYHHLSLYSAGLWLSRPWPRCKRPGRLAIKEAPCYKSLQFNYGRTFILRTAGHGKQTTSSLSSLFLTSVAQSDAT